MSILETRSLRRVKKMVYGRHDGRVRVSGILIITRTLIWQRSARFLLIAGEKLFRALVKYDLGLSWTVINGSERKWFAPNAK